tara:strand:- start:265 stop:762 length:498 start_codon:yes stop_codon:yes gene_type:complete
MFENPLMLELFMMLSVMIVLVILYIFFTRRGKGKGSQNEPVVEKFKELIDILDKKTLMQLGKLDIANISSKRAPLVTALKQLKQSAEGFTSSIDNIINMIGDNPNVLKKKALEPEIDDDEQEEDDVDDVVVDEDDVEEAIDDDDDDEPEDVEGFVDAHAHGYMSV